MYWYNRNWDELSFIERCSLFRVSFIGFSTAANLVMTIIINPRRACAARITVGGLCVCPSVR